MRMFSNLPAALALLAAACQTPDAPPSQHAAEAPTSACAGVVASSGALGAMALFEAATTCASEDRKEDANTLMMLGHVRAMADVAILKPADEDAERVLAEMAGQLYYEFGGLGFDEIYRDPAAVERLALRVESAVLNLGEGYDPGWAYKPTSKADLYGNVIANLKRHRVWQMRNFALTIQNDTYYEAHLAHNELQRANRIFVEGTPAYDESIRLSAIMSEASASIPQLPPPEDTLDYARLNAPEEDAGFQQIAVGLNGLEDQQTAVFNSAAEVEASWLARAYSPDALAGILDGIDFERDALIVYAIGERVNTSGRLTVSELEYDSRFGGYSISVRVGIVPESCGVPKASSFTFVLATVARGETSELNGTSMSHFPDACGPIPSGEAVLPN